jgi:hypothetical protein
MRNTASANGNSNIFCVFGKLLDTTKVRGQLRELRVLGQDPPTDATTLASIYIYI